MLIYQRVIALYLLNRMILINENEMKGSALNPIKLPSGYD